MDFRDRIHSDSDIMMGKPVIKNTRITVECIMKKMAEGADIDALLDMYPNIKREDILAVLSYCAYIVSQEEIIAC